MCLLLLPVATLIVFRPMMLVVVCLGVGKWLIYLPVRPIEMYAVGVTFEPRLILLRAVMLEA